MLISMQNRKGQGSQFPPSSLGGWKDSKITEDDTDVAGLRAIRTVTLFPLSWHPPPVANLFKKYTWWKDAKKNNQVDSKGPAELQLWALASQSLLPTC